MLLSLADTCGLVTGRSPQLRYSWLWVFGRVGPCWGRGPPGTWGSWVPALPRWGDGAGSSAQGPGEGRPRWPRHTLATIQGWCCGLSTRALWTPYPRFSFVQLIQLVIHLWPTRGRALAGLWSPGKQTDTALPSPVLHLSYMCVPHGEQVGCPNRNSGRRHTVSPQ